MAAVIARAISTSRLATMSVFLPKRFLSSSSSSSISNPPSLPSLLLGRRNPIQLSRSLRVSSPCSIRLNTIRCRVNRSGDSSYSPLNSGSNFSDRPPTEMAPLFPGCDYEHWLIVMENPGGEGATKQQMIDCYIQTLAKVVGRYENLFYLLLIKWMKY